MGISGTHAKGFVINEDGTVTRNNPSQNDSSSHNGCIIFAIILVVILIIIVICNLPQKEIKVAPTTYSQPSRIEHVQSSSQTANNKINSIPTISSSVFVLSGKLGSYPIHMRLTLSGHEATGTYYYDKYSEKKYSNYMTLKGTVNGTSCVVKEYNLKGVCQGTFSGTLTGNIFSGTFTHLSDGKQLAFSLNTTSSY